MYDTLPSLPGLPALHEDTVQTNLSQSQNCVQRLFATDPTLYKSAFSHTHSRTHARTPTKENMFDEKQDNLYLGHQQVFHFGQQQISDVSHLRCCLDGVSFSIFLLPFKQAACLFHHFSIPACFCSFWSTTIISF